MNLDDVPPHAEPATRKIHVVALVLQIDEPPEDLFAGGVLSPFYGQHHGS